jgi:hypothetical protein
MLVKTYEMSMHALITTDDGIRADLGSEGADQVAAQVTEGQLRAAPVGQAQGAAQGVPAEDCLLDVDARVGDGDHTTYYDPQSGMLMPAPKEIKIGSQ